MNKIDLEAITFAILNNKLGMSASSDFTTSSSISTASSFTTDKKKIWRLSSGVAVEEVMTNFTLQRNYEKDVCWSSMFIKEDPEETSSFKLKQLENIPGELQDYLDYLKTIDKIDNLLKAVIQESFHPIADSTRE
ncbi:hypothetical protein G6F57_000267 [Rhizopus arrhizus]|uniref:Uncharacterized protein n=1 Tax=Rhizopus oryzae TaxID=64495 RepID=A0A9P6XKD3_RHIOR|nr:hypothetical protein G6F23_001415 [Rhizopus arrhizus]KAG1424874.1 hypothetical protein G6F58_002186 [Rhizopus delemar]KAG0769974.1 hypothetical protein G6F24_000635 [Rhizopus arrhizus]KAG0772702.1 hypothetical protein G6F22_015512 [Rhizopus arrhizus]KAG0797070.1 hypothetical protein G6F21_000821 [Rhizopus arrhizus]